MKRFLIVNPFGIGDVLFTTPLIDSMRSGPSDGYIGYLCNIRTAPLLFANPNVDKVFIFEKDEYRSLWKVSKRKCLAKLLGLLKDIKKEKFDVVFDLSLAQEYGLFLMLAGIRERVGYNYRKRGLFLTKKIDLAAGYLSKHIVEYYMDLGNASGIMPMKSLVLKIYIPDENRKRAEEMLTSHGIGEDELFVTMSPGAGASWGAASFCKQWPKENFLKVARSICDKSQFKVLLLGGEDDKDICDYIKRQEPRCINLCAETDLLTFASLISKAKLLITNDGGPLHVGIAVVTKTISIFGPVDDKVYGPYPPGKDHIVIRNNSLECRPCYKGFKMAECSDRKCLEGVTADTVMAAVKRVLKI